MVNYVRIFAIIRIQLKLSKIQWKSEIFGFGKIFFALVFERKLSNCTMLAAFNRVFKVSFSTFFSFLTQLVYFENCEISVKMWIFSNYSHISSLLLFSFARNWCEAQLRLCWTIYILHLFYCYNRCAFLLRIPTWWKCSRFNIKYLLALYFLTLLMIVLSLVK